ncbi:ribonuclease III, partial [mine drainage metagenome]
LELKLGYRFQNQAVMDLALTHRSHAQPHNERLEFLGDAVLGWVVAECLYRMYPEWNEGQLTRARAGLVRQKTLAELADSMNLGEQLRVGGGIVLEGAARERALASALEALLGGIVLEAGPETAQSVIERLLRRWWPIISDFADHKDAKTRLQERLQGEGLPPPATCWKRQRVQVIGAASGCVARFRNKHSVHRERAEACVWLSRLPPSG